MMKCYKQKDADWKPAFRCPIILGMVAETEAQDDSVERDIDIFEGFEGLREMAPLANKSEAMRVIRKVVVAATSLGIQRR